MKRTFFNKIKTFLAGVAIIALASCSDIASDVNEAKNDSGANGDKVTVTFNMTTPSRSALPTVDLTSYNYKVKYRLNSPGDTVLDYSESSVFTGNSNISLTLSTGIFDFELNAYRSSDTNCSTAILTGTASPITVDASTGPISVVMKAAETL